MGQGRAVRDIASIQRHNLVTGWDAASRRQGTQGTLVHLAQSPIMVPYAFRTPKPGGRNTPAGHARPWPGSATPSKPDSLDRNRRSQARGAPAILLAQARLRPNRALLRQAYVFAACNLHFVLDGFPLPFALPSEEEFRALIGER
jgi:hypothetical protein